MTAAMQTHKQYRERNNTQH